MDPFEIHPSENALIKQPLFQLTDGLNWKGSYVNVTAYVMNDVVIGPSGFLVSGLLQIGHVYLIHGYSAGDDFTNVGGSNSGSVIFTATGTTPTDWSHGSILYKLDDYTVAYKFVKPGPLTGVPPPEGTPFNWEVLPPELAASIQSLFLELVLDDKVVVSYRYQITGPQLTSGMLVVGAKYEIVTFNAGDDFANVGASSNADGVFFTATGTTPTTWSNASVLQQVEYPSNILPADGLFTFELLSDDTAALNGLYELRTTIRWLDVDYFASGGQADVLCTPDFLQVTPC